MTPKLQSGSRIFVYINGNPLGLLTDFSFSSETPDVEIRGIDVAFPIELASGTTSVSGTIGLLKLINDSGAQSYGLASSQIDSSKQKYVSLTLIDRGFDTVIFQCDYAKITNESWRIATKTLMEGTLTFKGIVWGNSYDT